MAIATDYDYTQEQQISADDFEIVLPVAHIKSADEIEAESGFDEIPDGVWELEIIGFLEAPKAERKTVFVNKVRKEFDTHSVVVKFCLPDDRSKQVTDFMLLPPAEPDQWDAYFNGSKKADSKGAGGFNARKFFHFMERIGFTPIANRDGTKTLPPEAARLGNWKGRRVVAEIIPGDDYTKTRKDTETGEEIEEVKAGRNQIKPFTYRETGGLTRAPRSVAERDAMKGNTPPTAPAPATTRKSAVATQSQPAAQRGMAAPGRPAGTSGHPAAAPTKPTQPDPRAMLPSLKADLQDAIASEDFDRAKTIKAQIAQIEGAANRGAVPAAAKPATADRGLGNI